MPEPKKDKIATPHDMPHDILSLGKCLTCDQWNCPGHTEALRFYVEAQIRAVDLIEEHGWKDLDIN